MALDNVQITSVLKQGIVHSSKFNCYTRIVVALCHYVSIGNDLLLRQNILIARIINLRIVTSNLSLITILIVCRNSTGHNLHDVAVLPIATRQVTTTGAPEVVVCTISSVLATTFDRQNCIISRRLESLISIAYQLRSNLRCKVRFLNQRRELTNLNCIAELNPLSLVATIDPIIERQLCAIRIRILFGQVLDSSVSPLCDFLIDIFLIVVVVLQQTCNKCIVQRKFTVILSQCIPSESLHSVANTSQSPVLSFNRLIDEVLEVHTHIPIYHTPLLTTIITTSSITVCCESSVARSTHILSDRAGSTNVPIKALHRLLDTRQIEGCLYIVRGINILIDVKPLLAASESYCGQHHNTCKYLFHINICIFCSL